jgi:hypothetical protein
MTNSIESRISELESKLQKLQDKDAIRTIAARYCRAVDRADVELLKSCYWDDGFDDHGFFGGNAMEFAEHLAPLLRETAQTTHAVSNVNIELEGDKAYCECYVDVIHRLLDKDSQIVEWCQCRYLDNFERRDGEWRILVRGVVLDGMFWMKGDYSEVVTRGLGEIAGTDGGAVSARYPDDGVYNLRGAAGKTTDNHYPG